MLSSPDNFTGSAASGQVPASPGHEEGGGGGASSGGNMRGFGLAEVSSEDEARRDKPVDKDAGELQTDLFRCEDIIYLVIFMSSCHVIFMSCHLHVILMSLCLGSAAR